MAIPDNLPDSRPAAAPGAIPMISADAVERALREAFQAVTPEAPPPSARTTITTTTAPGGPPPLFGAPAAAPPPGVVPSPAPPPATAPAPAPAGGRLRDLVNADGVLDIEAVYRLGRVPDARLSADLLWRALASLPEDAPELARRAAFRATVVALLGPAGVGPETVVADARLRCLRLTQYLSGLETELGADRERVVAEIKRLEEMLAARRAEIAHLDATREAARRNCADRTASLEDITRLLTEEAEAASPLAAAGVPPAGEDGGEMPSYLREDSVRSLLGLPDGPAPKVT